MKESEAVWAVATLGTATAKEVAEVVTGDESARSHQATSLLTKLYRRGLLVRRKRRGVTSGKDPFEYAIASPDTSHGGEMATPDDADAADA